MSALVGVMVVGRGGNDLETELHETLQNSSKVSLIPAAVHWVHGCILTMSSYLPATESVWVQNSDPVYMSQSATTEKFVQQTSAKNPITGPVYMSKAPRSTEYFDRGVSEKFV